MLTRVNYSYNSQKCGEKVTSPTTNSDPSRNGLLLQPIRVWKKKTLLIKLNNLIIF